MKVACLNCGRPYPDEAVPHRCPRCGGLYDDLDPIPWSSPDTSVQGIWRHAASLGPWDEQISLGEGNTPLIEAQVHGRKVFFKCEFANPTGSFKDRGSAALVSFLRARGVDEAVEDSSGNAGASFAAYAARAGIHARIFVPESASGPKRLQIAAYGSELVPIPGPRSEASLAAEQAAASGAAYASHAYLPYNLAGYATAAFELFEQLDAPPGAVIVPAGQGGLLLGIARGMQALRAAGRIDKVPVLVGVQAAACAPLAAYIDIGLPGLGFITEGQTVAEGVRVRSPLRMQAVVNAVRESVGQVLAVDEAEILPGRDSLARLGFYVEPTSALVWAALGRLLPTLPDPVVAILTGSGYKSKPDWEH